MNHGNKIFCQKVIDKVSGRCNKSYGKNLLLISCIMFFLLFGNSSYPVFAEGRKLISLYGVGNVHIGMSVTQVSRVLRSKLKRRNSESYRKDCWFTTPIKASQKDGLNLMFKYDKLVAIYLSYISVGENYHTRDGIQIGSSAKDISRVYNKKAIKKENFYIENVFEYTIMNTKNTSGILFIGDPISEIRVADKDSIKLVESCS